MKLMLPLLIGACLFGCRESPERKYARIMLTNMEQEEALASIESAAFNMAVVKERLQGAMQAEGDKLDLARWEQESNEASEAAEKMGISLDKRMEAMSAGYAKFYAKKMK